MKKLILLLTVLSIFPLASFAEGLTGQGQGDVDCAAIVDGQGKTGDTPVKQDEEGTSTGTKINEGG